jgi:translocation and assembly module TamB
VASNAIPLDQIQTIAKDRPGVKGTLAVKSNGALSISKAASGNITAQISELHADINAAGLQMEEQRFGNVHLTANTEGTALAAHLESDFANSVVRGDGRWQLTSNYPGSAQITVSKLDLARLRDWLSPARKFDVAGSAEGSVMIEGPAFQPENWKAVARIPQFEVAPAPGTLIAGNRQALTIRNSGPIEVAMQNSVIRIVAAHFVASSTDFTVGGSVSLKQRNPLDLKIKGQIGLAILQDFDRDILSSGTAVADADVRGSFERPQVGGRLELKDISINYADLPNGLSNGNGVIVFSGTRANIQSLTAETGGGKLTLSGFGGYGADGLLFHVQISAADVRVRYPEGVSTVADAELSFSGTTENSIISGDVTILRTGFNPRTDLASVLAKSAEPVRTPSSQAGFLSGLHFDVTIESAPDISVQSTLAENVQMEASLRLRGTALNPALLGRVTITQGQLIFFGTKFTIDQGAISFFNPVKIEPVLNIDLETKARGVDVILTVSGPLNKLNLTPRSDPPLQFSEIVALLATGRAPTSDPLLLSRQSSVPSQSWQQMGASALLGSALANPVAGRLQRFFGVTKLRIDPTLTGVENNPQASITIEQQVTPEITFTYITNVTSSNPQVVRVEWAINKTWSVVLLREENGLFGIDFLYKKRFK